MDEVEEACPVCRSDRYLNPSMFFLVSPCFHKICDGCVGRLFASGSAPCPICHASLRKGLWQKPTFEDVLVERECRVRKRLASIFCKQQEDFEDLRAYNDYLEEIEDLVFSLVNNQDVQEVEAKLEAYRLANHEQIRRGLSRYQQEEEQTKAELAQEQARKRAAQEAALRDLEMEAKEAQEQESSFIKALETSSESAMEIQGRMAKKKQQQLRPASSARVVSIEDELPSLRGLKSKTTRSGPADALPPFDPLETVALVTLPPSLSPPMDLDERTFKVDGMDPFALGSESERMLAAGYTKAWLLHSCWEAAFTYGLYA